MTDLTGRTFGRLTVLGFAGRYRSGAALWLCRCEEGNKVVAHGYSLTSGNTKSCGCLQRQRTSDTHLRSIVGYTFGRLTVVKRIGATILECRCLCGNVAKVRRNNLTRGTTKSCGCLNAEMKRSRSGRNSPHFKHGQSAKPTRTYQSWVAMTDRCYRPGTKDFVRYGAAGVTVSNRWRGAEGFQNFLLDLGERPNGTTLGRFADSGNYEPSNCRWMSPKEQGAEARKKRAQVRY